MPGMCVIELGVCLTGRKVHVIISTIASQHVLVHGQPHERIHRREV
jgi:hypothetical protein